MADVRPILKRYQVGHTSISLPISCSFSRARAVQDVEDVGEAYQKQRELLEAQRRAAAEAAANAKPATPTLPSAKKGWLW
jgi:hypothetical protein